MKGGYIYKIQSKSKSKKNIAKGKKTKRKLIKKKLTRKIRRTLD
jgi:hypothetical protein